MCQEAVAAAKRKRDSFERLTLNFSTEWREGERESGRREAAINQ